MVTNLASLSELIFPSRCIGCSALGIALCSKCRRGWNPHFYQTRLPVRDSQTNLTVTSSVVYSDIASKILLAAKESHIKSADALLAEAIFHSLTLILRNEWIDSLVPIPSRKSAARLRGRQFIEEISNLVSLRSGIPVRSILTHQRKVRDQSGLHIQERRNNLDGALVVQGNRGGFGRTLLVDDLVTTGATLSEAARALRYAGIEVVGAVTAALAQPVR